MTARYYSEGALASVRHEREAVRVKQLASFPSFPTVKFLQYPFVHTASDQKTIRRIAEFSVTPSRYTGSYCHCT